MNNIKIWLHWIGNSFYTIPKFIKESKKLGVSRRIKPNMLKQMNWGDKIYLASREPGKRWPCIFGYFFLERVKGVDLKNIPQETLGHLDNLIFTGPPLLAMRGCGQEVSGGWYVQTTADVKQLAEFADSDSSMVTGNKFFVLPEPFPMLRNLPSFRGFRLFNEEKFKFDLIASKGKSGRRVLKGLYYG